MGFTGAPGAAQNSMLRFAMSFLIAKLRGFPVAVLIRIWCNLHGRCMISKETFCQKETTRFGQMGFPYLSLQHAFMGLPIKWQDETASLSSTSSKVSS